MSRGDSIRAGEAYVEGSFKGDKLDKGLRQSAANMKAFAGTIKAVSLQLAAIGSAILAPIVLSLNTFRKVGAELDDMRKRTGASVGWLSQMRYAASQSGTSIQALETALKSMDKTLLAAQNGQKNAVSLLGELGLSSDHFKGLKPEAQFELIADRLNGIEDPGRRAAIALKLLGRSGLELLPMIAELDELKAKATELGIVFTPEAAHKADELDDALDTLNKTFEGLRSAVGNAVASMATDFLGTLTKVTAKATEFVNLHQGVVGTVVGIGAAFTAVGTAGIGAASTFNTLVKAIENYVEVRKRMEDADVAGTMVKLASGAKAAALQMTTLKGATSGVLALLKSPAFTVLAGFAYNKLGIKDQLENMKQMVEMAKKNAGPGETAGDLFGKATEAGVKTPEEFQKFLDDRKAKAAPTGISNAEAMKNLGTKLGFGDGASLLDVWNKNARTSPVMRGISGALGTAVNAVSGAPAGAIRGIASAAGLREDPMLAFDRQHAEARKRAAQEADDEIARLRIESEKKGTEKELALIDLRRQQEEKRLRESGDFSENELRLQLEKLDMIVGFEKEAVIKGDVTKSFTSAGTFRGDLAGQQLAGGTIEEQQLAELKKMATSLGRLEQKDGGLLVS